jgi:exportin-1
LLIKQKWLALPEDQRTSLRGYVVELILQYSAVDNLPKSIHNILSKFNSILVQIVKYEWNSTWRSFINDICESSTKNMNIC